MYHLTGCVPIPCFKDLKHYGDYLEKQQEDNTNTTLNSFVFINKWIPQFQDRKYSVIVTMDELLNALQGDGKKIAFASAPTITKLGFIREIRF